MVQTSMRIGALAHPLPASVPPRRGMGDAASSQARTARLRARQERADAVTIGTLIVCMALGCLLGTIWLTAYARLSWQAGQLHQVQQSLALAEERHEALTQKVALLQSERRIKFLAAGMKMVPGGASHYLTPDTDAPRLAAQDRPAPQRVADAR